MFDVEFFTLPNGDKPVKIFLNSLDKKTRAKILFVISLLEMDGNQLREPYSKPIHDGLFELRINYSSNTARVFYFFVIGKKVVLTNGFMKKTNKTPKDEIDKALKYKNDYERKYLP